MTQKDVELTKGEKKNPELADKTLNSIKLYQKVALASTENLYKEFGTSEKGLSSDEVRRRFEQYGPNAHPASKKPGFIGRFFLYLKNWFNLMLLLASILSFLSGVISQDSSSSQVGYVLIGVVLANIFFSMIQEYRADRVVQTINKLIHRKLKSSGTVKRYKSMYQMLSQGIWSSWKKGTKCQPTSDLSARSRLL
jgi:magnesium-transporting ATPase (P-type)